MFVAPRSAKVALLHSASYLRACPKLCVCPVLRILGLRSADGEWLRGPSPGTRPARDRVKIASQFTGWMLSRRQPQSRQGRLSERVCPPCVNP